MLKISVKFVIFLVLIGLIAGVGMAFIAFNFVENDKRFAEDEKLNVVEVKNNNILVNESLAKNNSDKEKNEPIKILFGGDVMLDRSIRLVISQKGVNFLTEKVKDIFQDQDVVMINLEGPVTSNASVSNVPVSDPNHFRFTFDKEQTKDFFELNNINVVGTGNNHILNFGKSGEQETRKFLEENNVAYTGMPNMRENNSVIKEVKNKKIAFVAYNYAAGLTRDQVVDVIKRMKNKSDFIVVYAHWGSEYHLRESESQRSLAYMFVDAGADVIIGSHPHVVQPIEIYKDKVIFYSLGNLVFDQYFSRDVREKLMVNLILEDDKISFVLIPLYSGVNGQLEFMGLEQRNIFLNRIANDSSSISDIIRNGIKEEKFSLNLK